MSFHPNVRDELTIDGVTFHFTEHPAAPGMPYGQEGRQATVYQIAADSDLRALKVFKPRCRVPALVTLANRLAAFADLPGLQVCKRQVLTARRHGDLLRHWPDLTYSIVMPWIEGPTWMQTLIEWQVLSPSQGLRLAESLASILNTMEEHNLAHCDVSGPNVLLCALSQSDSQSPSPVALVDVEQFYGPGWERPEWLTSGSPGYAHRTATNGLWEPRADRFAGAVLIAEMLGWCDGRVQQAAWGESYFDPGEMHQDTERYRILSVVLREKWGAGVAGLFERAWHSEALAECATFSEWLVNLPIPTTLQSSSNMSDLIDHAKHMEQEGDLASALETYRQAQAQTTAGTSLAQELTLIVRDLDRKAKAEARLDKVARDVAGMEREGHWHEAAEAYRRLVEQTIDIRKREEWEAARQRCEQESRLADLFGEGLSAYEESKWAKAKELFGEVVRLRPGYAARGERAAALLAEVEEQLAANARAKAEAQARSTRPKSRARWLTISLAVIGLVAVILASAALWSSGVIGSPHPTPTPVVLVVTSTPTLTPIPPTPTSTTPPTQTPFIIRETVVVRQTVPPPPPTVIVDPVPVPAPATQAPQPSVAQSSTSPDQTVWNYYSYINKRRYDITWAMLSNHFKDKWNCCTPDGKYDYKKYVEWWDSVAHVDIGVVRTRTQSDSTATVYAELHYRLNDGRYILDTEPYILLVVDPISGGWLFDDKVKTP